jgi:hypothetical protein
MGEIVLGQRFLISTHIRTMGGWALLNRPIRHGRARPGSSRPSTWSPPGQSESFRQLHDIDDRDKVLL